MAFIPLLPPSEPSSSQSETAPSQPQLAAEPVLLEVAPVAEETLASLTVHHDAQSESEAEDSADPESSGSRHRHRLMNMPSYTSSPSSSTTPSLSSASDTDDMDTESEAPSVIGGSSEPPSPGERDIPGEYFIIDGEINPYFPSVLATAATGPPRTPRQDPTYDVCKISQPGQTPPLSAMYPGVALVLKERDDDGGRKVKLEAIPSPSLVPPSPFSLYPPTATANADGASNVAVTMTKRAFFTRTTSRLSVTSLPSADALLSGGAGGADGERVGLGVLLPSLSRRKEAEGEVEVSIPSEP